MRYGDNKQKYVRYAIYAVIIVIAAILQNTVGFPPPILGVSAFWLIPVCVCIAMFEREVAAAIFGAFSGVLWDVSLGRDGFNAFILLIICAVCSLLVSHFMRKNVLTSLVLCGGSVVLYSIAYVTVNLVAAGAGGSFLQVVTFYLPSCVYTLALCPIVYFIVSWVYSSHKTADE